MQADGLLTFLGLVLAAWAITPAERLYDLRVRMTWIDWTIAAATVAILHYILYLPVLEQLGVAIDLGPWRWGFTAELASYGILIASTVLIAVRLSYGRLRRRKIVAFRRQSEELLFRRKYAELIFLLDRHLPALIRIHENRYALPRLREKVEPPTWVDVILNGEVAQESPTRDVLNNVRSTVSKLLPTYARTQEAATHALRRVLLSEPFVRESAVISPELGLRLLTHDIPDRNSFLEKWISALLRDRTSVLYYEVEQNQNTGAGGRFHYPETNRIVYTLFRDAARAHELGIYKPLGDFALRRLDAKFRKGGIDRYNEALDDFDTAGRWHDPIHTVLRLFEFMVSEAVYERVQWHMWLYYVPHFVERIERNMHPAKSVDPTKEWPTPYHYFLYECFSLMWNWIAIAKSVDDTNPHAAPESVDTEHENGNIPKSACIALGQAWFAVAESTRLSDSFKVYLLEATVSRINGLRGSQRLDQFRHVALQSIMVGGWRTGSALKDHQGRTLPLFRSVDHVLRGDIESELLQYKVS